MNNPTSNKSSAKKTTMNHAPVEKERECWECLCVGRALVRVTSRSFPAAAATADVQTFRPRNFSGARFLVS